jgi:diguanylate cyclase (GGDEF)-like protein
MDILIVDDQRTTGLALTWILAKLGHTPRLVSSGEEALELIERGDWRVVITDWIMPGMDGLELCRRIRARGGRPYIYIIVLTGLTGRDRRLEALEAGPDDFLTKPVDPDELALRLAIGRRILDVQAELEEKNALLSEMACTDPLTGLANRRGLRAALDRLLGRPGQSAPLSILALDVDHFKSYNDEFGHFEGDEVLRRVAGILRSSVRGQDDLVARTGGEEFMVVLPGADAEASVHVAEALRRAIATYPWSSRPITVSVGAASSGRSSETPDVSSLMTDADRALYHSKRTGRDRVTHSAQLMPEEPPEAQLRWLPSQEPCAVLAR